MNVELYVIYTTLLGVITILLSFKFKQLQTLVSIMTLTILALLVIQDRSPAGLIGLTSTLIALASSISSTTLIKEDKTFHDTLFLVLVSTAYLVASSQDLIRLFVYWEVMSISIAVLTTFEREEHSMEAALKYVMMCSSGSLLALAGIALAITETGASTFSSLAGASVLSKILIIVGFGVEAAVFPLHFWLPDVHMSAPSTVSAILSGISIETAAYTISRVAAYDPMLSIVLCFSAIIGMFIGNLSAYSQDDLKRLLAYSSVANVGYIILGLNSGVQLAKTFSLLHILAHGLLKASLFLLAGFLMLTYSSRKLSKIRGVASTSPILKFTIISASIGLTGVPPFLTFWSEAFILIGVFASQKYGLFYSIFLSIAIILSFGYYFKTFYTLVVPTTTIKQEEKLKEVLLIPILILIILAILLGFTPDPLIRYFNL